jgi:Flp pilus assembly protein TadG
MINRFKLGDSSGSALIETALILPVLMLVLAGSVDLGRACYLMTEVSSAAEAGSLYGIQQMGDTSGMVLASQLEATDIAALSTTPKYGCECSDGSSVTNNCLAAPTCTYNVVNYVEVSTQASYNTLLPWPGIPNTLTLSGWSHMRAAH